jgi:hypothetical protein
LTVEEIRNALKIEKANGAIGTELSIALKCNALLADVTAAHQTQSSTASVQSFGKFSASVANNSQLVTTHLVSAFMPTFFKGFKEFPADPSKPSAGDLDPHVNSHFYNDLGFDVSASVPISSATIADYAKQELLIRDGGLLNLYRSFSGRNYTNEAYAWGDRTANLDRLYVLDIFAFLNPSQPATAKQGLVFISQGWGVKALKTALTGTGPLGAQGTVYMGLGVDGPLFFAGEDPATAAKNATNNPAGMMSLEFYASGNIVDRQALNALVGSTNKYLAWGANLSLFVTNSVGIQVQYVMAQKSGVGRSVGHVAMLTLGYNKPSAPAASTQNSEPASP